MTAEEFRTAATSLRSAVEDAPLCRHPGCGHYGGYHKVDGDGLTVCTDCDYDAHRYIGPGFEMPDGIGMLLADWLEQAVRALEDGGIAIPDEALAVARKINTKEQDDA